MKRTTKFTRRFGILSLALAAALALQAGPALAAPLTWNNGAGNMLWDTASANWGGATLWNNGTPDNATFDSTGAGTVTLGSAITVGAITFNTAGYTIAGGGYTLTLNNTVTVGSGLTANISGPTTGTAALTKSGTGTLEILSGGSIVRTGASVVTYIDGGTVQVDSGGLLDVRTVSTSDYSAGIRVASGVSGTTGYLVQKGGDVKTDHHLSIAYVSGSTGTYTMEGGMLSVLSDSTANGYMQVGRQGTGTFTQSGGDVEIQRTYTNTSDTLMIGAGGTGSGLYTMTGGSLTVGFRDELQNNVAKVSNGSNGTLTINGELAAANFRQLILGHVAAFTGTLNLQAGTLRIGGGNMTKGAGAATFNFSGGTLAPYNNNTTIGSSTAANNFNITLTGTGANISSSDKDGTGRTVTIYANLTSTGSIAFSGKGTTTLNGANDYTGNTTISGGTLALSSGSTLAAGSSISIAAGATFDMSAKATYTLGSSASLTASGTGTTIGTTAAAIKGGTTVNLGSRPITLTYDGSNPALYISQGTLSLNNNPFTINGSSVLADGDYNIVTAASAITDGSINYPTPTGTALTGKTASITVSGGNVVLTVSGGAVTTVDHFEVTGISSPQTAGTAITGVTITAQNADNTTTTDFTGKVVFSGTAGITGTSAAFTAGQLTGVSVTPITAGIGKTFIVTGSTKTGSATFDVNPGAVSETNSTATASPATGVSTDGGATSTITVTAKDANNNLIAGAEVSAGSDGTGNTLSTPANTNVSGQTTFTIASTKAETKTLTVTIAGTSITEQPTVEFVAGTAAAIALTWGDNQNGDVATALASPFVVTVTDANENPVAGQSVTFAVATSPSGATGQSLSITNATTDAYGQGTSTLTLGSVPGSYTVAATATGLTGSPVTFTATATLPAGSFVKAATGTDLIDGASWSDGVAPTSTDVAYWISSSLDTGLTLGTSSAWAGINVAGALTDIGITGAGTLTLGSSGIDMSVAGVNLSMDNPITLNAAQTWTVNAARTLTLSGSLSSATTGTKTLTVNGAGNTQIGGNISNGTEGTLALTKSGTGTLTLSGTSNTYTDLTTVSGGTLVVAHQNALQNSTLSYSAGTLQLGNSTNNMTAVTLGGLSGSSNIALTNAYSTPASVALTVGNNSASTTYDGVLSDGTVAGGSLTKTGTGTLTLSKAQTYTGPTTITGGGTLKIGVTSTGGSQTYNTTGTGTWTAPTGITSVNYTVVGGGGGGGANNGGGGGGGQVLQGTMSVTSGTGYSYSIGAGGAGRSGNTLEGFNGSPSSFGTITAFGGGGGGCNAIAGIGTSTLGSAGGGGCNGIGGTATGGQGFSGGNGVNASPWPGGGGGGAGGAGSNGSTAGGGGGGIGVQCAANSLWYGAGGGGAANPGPGGSGGSGVGGIGGPVGTAATNGSNGSGGGGGGGTGTSGAGGPGAVVLSWGSSLPATLPSATALSITDGSTLDLNGTAQTVASLSVAGTGVGTLGAVINSSATPATLTLASGITLSANSTMAGTGSNLTIALGSGQPISLTYDGLTPALSISQGTLSLNNNPFTINGSVLANGEYYIVTATAITDGSTTYPTPTGTALTGKTASITVSGGNVVLTVSGGGDVTPPAWVSGWPKVDTATSTGFTARATTHEAGNAYYVVVAGGATGPTAAQVKAGHDSTGSPALKSNTLSLTADTENSALVTGLSPGMSYDIWFVAEDGLPNLQSAPSMVSVTTHTTFAEWIGTFSGVGDPAGLTDDADFDGMQNFVEFALNSSPVDGRAQGKAFLKLATVGGTPNVLTLTVTARSGATFSAEGNNQKAVVASDALTYLIEASATLGDWGTPVVTEIIGADATAIQATLTPSAPDSGWTYHTFRTAGSAATHAREFIHIKVTSP